MKIKINDEKATEIRVKIAENGYRFLVDAWVKKWGKYKQKISEELAVQKNKGALDKITLTAVKDIAKMIFEIIEEDNVEILMFDTDWNYKKMGYTG